MTIGLNQLISVSSSVQDAAAKAANFGSIGIFTDTALFVGWRTYSADADGLAEMVTDGFGTWHGAYQAALAAANANPGVTTIKVYARANADTETFTVTPTVTTDGYVYSFEVNGTTVTHTNSTDTVETICDALHTQINAIAGVSSTDNITDLTVAADDPTSVSLFIDLSSETGITLKCNSTDGGIATDFAAAVAADNGFYGMIVTGCHSEAQTAAAAALAEANGKMLLLLLPDTDIGTSSTTDAASDLEGAAYVRTAGIATRDMSGNGHVGLMARQFSRDPGSSNWNWQSIPGATADDYTLTAYNFIKGKTCGVYANFTPANTSSPLGVTQNIKGFSGRYLDITRGVDWLESSLASAIATELAAQEKVPNNAQGRGMIEKAMSAVFKQAERFGLIEPGWTITIPTKAEQSAADKASRALTGVKWTAVLTGAVDTVTVQGTLTL